MLKIHILAYSKLAVWFAQILMERFQIVVVQILMKFLMEKNVKNVLFKVLVDIPIANAWGIMFTTEMKMNASSVLKEGNLMFELLRPKCIDLKLNTKITILLMVRMFLFIKFSSIQAPVLVAILTAFVSIHYGFEYSGINV